MIDLYDYMSLYADDSFPRNLQPLFLPNINTSYMVACLSTSHLTWLWERHGNRLAEMAAIESSLFFGHDTSEM